MTSQDQFMTIKEYVQDYKDFEKYHGRYDIVTSWLIFLQTQYAGVIIPGFYLNADKWKDITVKSSIEDINRALRVPGLEKLCIFITLGNLTIGHANAIIVDLNRDVIWTFEPHGKRYTKRKEFIPQRAEAISIIKTELAKHFPSRIFQVHGIEELPFMGPQKRACKNNTCSVRIDQEKLKRETKGYCAAWTLMYIHYHAINPGMSSVDVNNLIDTRFSADELYNRVRGYAGAIYRNYDFAKETSQKEVVEPQNSESVGKETPKKTAAKKAGRKTVKKAPKKTVAKFRFRKTAGKKAGRKAAKKAPKKTVAKPRFRKTVGKKAGRKAAKKTPKKTVAKPRFRKTAGKKAGRKAAKPRAKGRR